MAKVGMAMAASLAAMMVARCLAGSSVALTVATPASLQSSSQQHGTSCDSTLVSASPLHSQHAPSTLGCR